MRVFIVPFSEMSKWPLVAWCEAYNMKGINILAQEIG